MNSKRFLFFLLCLQCVIISFNVAAIAALLPAMSRDLGISDILVSKVIPFYMIPYGLGALIYAPLVRRFPSRNLMIASMAVYAASSVLCAVVPNLSQILLYRIVMGISAAAAIPLGLMLIGKIFDKDIRGRMVGLFFSSSFFASMLGIVASGILPWQWIFLIPGVLAFLTAILVFIVRSEYLGTMVGERVDYLAVFRKVEIRNVFIFIFLISMFYHAVQSWFGVYLARIYELNQLKISFYFVLIALGGALGQIVGGFITDKKGRFPACYLGIILLAISTMLLFPVLPLWLVGLVFVGFSMGWTIGHNGLSTVLTDFPDEHRAEIASLNSSFRFFSGGVGFSLSRIFVEKSFGLTFLGIGILMLALSFFVRRVVPEK